MSPSPERSDVAACAAGFSATSGIEREASEKQSMSHLRWQESTPPPGPPHPNRGTEKTRGRVPRFGPGLATRTYMAAQSRSGSDPGSAARVSAAFSYRAAGAIAARSSPSSGPPARATPAGCGGLLAGWYRRLVAMPDRAGRRPLCGPAGVALGFVGTSTRPTLAPRSDGTSTLQAASGGIGLRPGINTPLALSLLPPR